MKNMDYDQEILLNGRGGAQAARQTEVKAAAS